MSTSSILHDRTSYQHRSQGTDMSEGFSGIDRTSPRYLGLGRSRLPEKCDRSIRQGLLARSLWVVMMTPQTDGGVFCVACGDRWG
jgi:hypothetical protein